MPNAEKPPHESKHLPPKHKHPPVLNDQTVDPEIVAESIEAGYDIQSDAATNSLANDPGSSSETESNPD